MKIEQGLFSLHHWAISTLEMLVSARQIIFSISDVTYSHSGMSGSDDRFRTHSS